MPHINVPENLAGIVSLFAFRPETAGALNGIAEVILKGDDSLSAWERELIATTGSSPCSASSSIG